MGIKTLRDIPIVRWFVFGLIVTLTFATYWFQDFFSGLKPLMESELKISSTEFGSIIQWTTFANVFGMIIIGGIVLDKFGTRIAGPIFAGFATIGGLIVAAGASRSFSDDPITNLYMLKFGRLFFGIGLEVVCVIVAKTIAKWFAKGFAFAMAMNMAFGRMGSAGATAFSIDIAGGTISSAASFAATLIVISFICLLIYLIFFDGKIDKQLGIKFGAKNSDEDQFKISDLGKIVTDRSFVFITLLCVAFYAAVFPFIQYCPDLLINKFGFSYELNLAGLTFWQKIGAIFTNGPKVTALIPLGTIIFTPIFGRYVSKKGKAATLMMLGSGLLIFAHLTLSVLNNVFLGYLGLLSLGIAFSLVPAAMWPSVAKIVDHKRLGTAYATMFTFQNWGLMGLFWGIGKVLDLSNSANLEAIHAKKMPYDYTNPILMLVGLGVLSIFLAYQLKRADKKQGYGLENPNTV